MQQSGPDHTDPCAEQCVGYATLVEDPILRNFKVKRDKPGRRLKSCPPRVVSQNSATPTSPVVPPCSAQVSDQLHHQHRDRQSICKAYKEVWDSKELVRQQQNGRVAVPQRTSQHGRHQVNQKKAQRKTPFRDEHLASKNVDTCKDHRKNVQRKIPLPDEFVARKIVEACKDRPGIVWEHAARCESSSATVQRALEMVVRDQQSDEAWAMTQGMRGHVWQACESRCANFFLTKFFAVMPGNLVSCLVEELHGKAVRAARCRFGCRCIISLVEHHATSVNDAVSEVMHQLCEEASSFKRHQYGKHVYRALEDRGLLYDG